jgi:cell pole-organizing protein PopZ
MTQAAKAQEPSMEEILASIRRIIADDDKPADKPAAKPEPKPEPPPVAKAPPPPPPPEPEPDILELTEAMQAPASPSFRKIDGRQDVVFDEMREAPEPPPRAPPPRAAPSTPQETASPIMSSATAAAVDSAFGALAHTVLVQNAKTLEDLVKEMLRPMLQHWLDNNLPTMVERLVRQEIERVARGRS